MDTVRRVLILSVVLPSIAIAAPGSESNLRRYDGYLVIGPESRAFVSKGAPCEYWSVTSKSDEVWSVIEAHFDTKKRELAAALVEIEGVLSAPGNYNTASADFDHEIEVTKLHYVRPVGPDELRGTAAIDGDCPRQQP
jgi:hypothetical protein